MYQIQMFVVVKLNTVHTLNTWKCALIGACDTSSVYMSNVYCVSCLQITSTHSCLIMIRMCVRALRGWKNYVTFRDKILRWVRATRDIYGSIFNIVIRSLNSVSFLASIQCRFKVSKRLGLILNVIAWQWAVKYADTMLTNALCVYILGAVSKLKPWYSMVAAYLWADRYYLKYRTSDIKPRILARIDAFTKTDGLEKLSEAV